MTDKPNDQKEPDSAGQRLLKKAYLLETPADNVSYYNQLADSYDSDFADGLGYALPELVANTYHSLAHSDDTPVVDIGCGTGLLGQALKAQGIELDGMDISSAMLSRSSATGLYRELHEVDLTQDLSRFAVTYRAVLSSGTFTHGHLGPDVFVRMLELAMPEALFVIAVNKAHFVEHGFDAMLNELVTNRRIVDMQKTQCDIYKQIDHEHGQDKGLIVSFRKN